MRKDGEVVIGIDLDSKNFEIEIENTEKELKELVNRYNRLQQMSKKGVKINAKQMEELALKIEKTNNKLLGLKKRQEELNKTDFSNLGKGMTNIIKKVSKWALAVFGIRSAYMAIRNAINTISQDDEQLAADIEYMKTALAYVLEPVVRRIVEWAKQLLFYIGYIIKMWTGKNIFENANKNLKSANGEAKKLQKTLAGFDEMNILNSDSTGGGGGITQPSFDLSNYDAIELEIEKMQDKWVEFYSTMEKNLYDTPFSIWTDTFGSWDLLIYGFTQTFSGLWNTIYSIGELFRGIWKVITGDVESGLEDLGQGLQDTMNSSTEIITGFGNIIKGFIKGIIQTIWGWLFEDINKAIEKFNDFKNNVVEVWNTIKEKIKETIKNIQDWLTKHFGVIGTKIGEVIGASFKAVINSVLGAIEKILNVPIRSINLLIGTINKVPGINLNKLETFNLPRLAKGGIVNMPSRGVPVGNAIAGERGAEGVIPLTDSQQMALLGEAIGKYITINAQMNNYMDGRLINRQLQKIQNESNFAMNR